MQEEATKSSQSVSKLVANVFHTFFGVITDIFNLALLEAKLAAKSLTILLGIMLLSVLLVAFTWFSIMGALVLWLITMGLNSSYAFLLVGILNLLGFIPILLVAKHQSQNLGFTATRKHLMGKADLDKDE